MPIGHVLRRLHPSTKIARLSSWRPRGHSEISDYHKLGNRHEYSDCAHGLRDDFDQAETSAEEGLLEME